VSSVRSIQILASMDGFVGTLLVEGRYAETEKLDRETLDIRRRVLL
jgi:hypothetical protein